MSGVPDHATIIDVGGATSLTFYCGELSADEAISAADHEPNGYFWEGLVRFVAPELAARVELDSESGMFAAYGDRATLEELQRVLAGYLDDGGRVATTIRDAESSGFVFDD